MIKIDDVIKGKERFNIKALVIGDTGAGKTFFGSTFPKCYFLITAPREEDTFLNNPELRKNIVGFDRFIPESPADTKRVFEELLVATKNAREMAKKGEIDTLVLDNISFLAEHRWIYIDAYEKEYTNSGAVNTLAMYGKLNRWLFSFVLMSLLTCPATS